MKLIDLKLSLSQLLLDPNNYRLDYDHNQKTYDDNEVHEQQNKTQERLEKERLGELRDSIIENGFLEMDRIVVKKLDIEGEQKFYIVIEGNRRTAAFKGLIDDYREGLLELPEDLVEKASSIGVVCIEGTQNEMEEFASSLMGIRHVSGPKKWTGYQSARLIYDRFEAGKSLTEIGALLGISAIDAGRRMRGYCAFLQMRNNDVYGKKSETKHYTLLLEFLTPGKIGRDWLDWDDKDFKFRNKKNLYRLYSAMTRDGDYRPEINNPTDARDFIKYLYSDNHREMIEKGAVLTELPPLGGSDNSKEKPFKNFLYLINELTLEDMTVNEIDFLNEINDRVQDILKDNGS